MNVPLVVGNWKMNCDFVEAIHLTQQLGVLLKSKPLENVEIAVAPPFVDIRSVTSVIESERIPVSVAAQHASIYDSGAHTGEVSVPMIKRLGASWVLVGHSERRTMYGQTDEAVTQLVLSVLRHDVKVILCCGEDLTVREAGSQNAFVADQLRSALTEIPEKLRPLVTIAYEPIWAIGTGLTASTAQVGEMVEHIRVIAAGLSLSDVRVLYGGSVSADNAQALMSEGGADGFLVGGASLKAESFWAIASAANDCYDGKR